MTILNSFSNWLRRYGWLVLLIVIIQFVLHIWVNAHDHIFRDELYYLAAARHLDLGYVDFPPFVALATFLTQALFGSSVAAIRLLPALAGALIVLVAAGIANELGGRPRAQVLAALAVALCPVFLLASGLLTMDIFDQLWWALLAWVLIRLIRRQEPRLWLLFGAVAGIGLLTKVTMAYFGFALVVGLLLTPQRKLLFNRWLLFGGAIALLIFSPYLVWQVQHGFPTLEFWRNYGSGKTFPVTPLGFFGQQVITTSPFALPLSLLGLYFLFFTQAGKPYRALGWAYLILYVIFTSQQAKFYFLAPTYPMLFASGACALQQIEEHRPRWSWLTPAYAGVLAVTGLLLVPLSVPLLPTQAFIRYNAMLGGAANVKQERLLQGTLPQVYADRYGWQEMVAAIAKAYDSLPEGDRQAACILTRNYGEASAVDYFGPAYGLPNAISGHNSYYIWGPGSCTGQVLVTVGFPVADLAPYFQSTQLAGQTACEYCLPQENNSQIVISKGLKATMQEVWPGVKAYN